MMVYRILTLLLPVTLLFCACESEPERDDGAQVGVGSPEPDPQPAPDAEAPRAEGEQLNALIARDDVLFLDVRRQDEIESLGTVAGALHIPIEELADRLDEIPRDKPILTA